MIINLSQDFTNKILKLNVSELRFKYNTNNNYFYFDLYDLDGNITKFHNKVVTGFAYDGFIFTSSNNDSFANISNISTFKLVENG